MRVRCEQCHAGKFVVFSGKKRRFCPSCGARRMAETHALCRLIDEGVTGAPVVDDEAR